MGGNSNFGNGNTDSVQAAVGFGDVKAEAEAYVEQKVDGEDVSNLNSDRSSSNGSINGSVNGSANGSANGSEGAGSFGGFSGQSGQSRSEQSSQQYGQSQSEQSGLPSGQQSSSQPSSSMGGNSNSIGNLDPGIGFGNNNFDNSNINNNMSMKTEPGSLSMKTDTGGFGGSHSNFSKQGGLADSNTNAFGGGAGIAMIGGPSTGQSSLSLSLEEKSGHAPTPNPTLGVGLENKGFTSSALSSAAPSDSGFGGGGFGGGEAATFAEPGSSNNTMGGNSFGNGNGVIGGFGTGAGSNKSSDNGSDASNGSNASRHNQAIVPMGSNGNAFGNNNGGFGGHQQADAEAGASGSFGAQHSNNASSAMGMSMGGDSNFGSASPGFGKEKDDPQKPMGMEMGSAGMSMSQNPENPPIQKPMEMGMGTTDNGLGYEEEIIVSDNNDDDGGDDGEESVVVSASDENSAFEDDHEDEEEEEEEEDEEKEEEKEEEAPFAPANASSGGMGGMLPQFGTSAQPQTQNQTNMNTNLADQNQNQNQMHSQHSQMDKNMDQKEQPNEAFQAVPQTQVQNSNGYNNSCKIGNIGDISSRPSGAAASAPQTHSGGNNNHGNERNESVSANDWADAFAGSDEAGLAVGRGDRNDRNNINYRDDRNDYNDRNNRKEDRGRKAEAKVNEKPVNALRRGNPSPPARSTSGQGPRTSTGPNPVPNRPSRPGSSLPSSRPVSVRFDREKQARLKALSNPKADRHDILRQQVKRGPHPQSGGQSGANSHSHSNTSNKDAKDKDREKEKEKRIVQPQWTDPNTVSYAHTGTGGYGTQGRSPQRPNTGSRGNNGTRDGKIPARLAVAVPTAGSPSTANRSRIGELSSIYDPIASVVTENSRAISNNNSTSDGGHVILPGTGRGRVSVLEKSVKGIYRPGQNQTPNTASPRPPSNGPNGSSRPRGGGGRPGRAIDPSNNSPSNRNGSPSRSPSPSTPINRSSRSRGSPEAKDEIDGKDGNNPNNPSSIPEASNGAKWSEQFGKAGRARQQQSRSAQQRKRVVQPPSQAEDLVDILDEVVSTVGRDLVKHFAGALRFADKHRAALLEYAGMSSAVGAGAGKNNNNMQEQLHDVARGMVHTQPAVSKIVSYLQRHPQGAVVSTAGTAQGGTGAEGEKEDAEHAAVELDWAEICFAKSLEILDSTPNHRPVEQLSTVVLWLLASTSDSDDLESRTFRDQQVGASSLSGFSEYLLPIRDMMAQHSRGQSERQYVFMFSMHHYLILCLVRPLHIAIHRR